MKKTASLLAVLLLTGLNAGCATNGDISDLQSQINTLKSQVSKISSDVAETTALAEAAVAQAAAAEAAANMAASYAEDTNSKLDRMFKRSMMK